MAETSTNILELCGEAYDNYDINPVIQGVKINCIPEKPKDITSIPGFGEAPEDMYFRKKDKFPEIFKDVVELFNEVKDEQTGKIISQQQENIFDHGRKLIGKSFEEKLKIDQEYCRNMKKTYDEGYWFFNWNWVKNKPELVYLTGAHYYYLTVWKIQIKKKVNGVTRKVFGYPFYRDADVDFFLFWRQAEISPKCYGVVMVAARRSGKTNRALCLAYLAATSIRKALSGMQAQNGDIAERLFSRLVDSWKELPNHEFFKPLDDGSDNPKKSINFTKPTSRSKKNKYKTYTNTLDSVIDWRNTKSTAYDSESVTFILLDEASKWETTSVEHTYSIIKETIADGAEATGKALLTSTAEDLSGKTLEEFENIVNESDQEDLNPLGQTNTGLWTFFHPAYKGYIYDSSEDGEIPEELRGVTLDKHGNSDEELSKRIFNAIRSKLKGDRLIHFKRKYPFTLQEAFYNKERLSPFPRDLVYSQKLQNDQMGFNPVVRGNFEWKDGNPETGIVKFYPTSEGKWYKAFDPEAEDRNQNRIIAGHKAPTRDYFVTGCDPISHAGQKGSRPAIITGCKQYPGHDLKKATVCLYYYRPSNPNEFFEDAIKQCVYYSSPLLCEQNIYDLFNYFRKRGYYNYLLFDPYKPAKPMWDMKSKRGMSATHIGNREALMNAGRVLVLESFGLIEKQGEDGEIEREPGFHPFPELIDDLLSFEQDAWTDYDIAVAFMFMAVAMANNVIKNKEEEKPRFSADDWMPKYSRNPISFR